MGPGSGFCCRPGQALVVSAARSTPCRSAVVLHKVTWMRLLGAGCSAKGHGSACAGPFGGAPLSTHARWRGRLFGRCGASRAFGHCGCSETPEPVLEFILLKDPKVRASSARGEVAPRAGACAAWGGRAGGAEQAAGDPRPTVPRGPAPALSGAPLTTPLPGVSSCLSRRNQQTNNSRYFPNWGTGGEEEGWRKEGMGSNPLVFLL